MDKYKTLDRATNKAMDIALRQIMKYLDKETNDLPYKVAFYRFYRKKDLPQEWESRVLFSLLIDYYKDNNRQTVKEVFASEADIEIACLRLEKAMLWANYRWLPVFKALLVKKLGGTEGLRDYKWWCISLLNNNKGSLEIGRVVDIILGE